MKQTKTLILVLCLFGFTSCTLERRTVTLEGYSNIEQCWAKIPNQTELLDGYLVIYKQAPEKIAVDIVSSNCFLPHSDENPLSRFLIVFDSKSTSEKKYPFSMEVSTNQIFPVIDVERSKAIYKIEFAGSIEQLPSKSYIWRNFKILKILPINSIRPDAFVLDCQLQNKQCP